MTITEKIFMIIGVIGACIADASLLIAIGGEYGTPSEIAFGLKMGKPVITLQS